VPSIVGIVVATLLSYYLAERSGISGIYAVGISAVGMLSVSGMIVSSDAYGPIVDNARGIAEMAGMSHQVIETTDVLDAAGNTAKAITKGFAISAAALTVLVLFAAYVEVVEEVMGGAPLPTAPVPITPPAEGEETGPLSPLPLPVQPGPTCDQGAVPGEVPGDLLTQILKDLQERKGIATEEITIERAEAVVWSDGSLGCPQPGMMYLQVLTPGYFVVLRVGDDLYNYHAGESGGFILCERSLPGEILPPEGGADPLLEE
jgi:hypothetical protein